MMFVRLSKRSVLFIFLVCSGFLVSCKKSKSDPTELLFFSENGVSWGYGKVLLQRNSDPLNFHIRSLKPDLPIGDSQNQFEFFITSNKNELKGKKWDLLYADKVYMPVVSTSTARPGNVQSPPVNSVALSADFIVLVFDYRVILRQGTNDTVDIYLVLKKPGIALEGRKEVLIGSAKFEAKNPLANIQLQNNVLVSKIIDGYRPENFVLHITVQDKVLSEEALSDKCNLTSSVIGQVRSNSQTSCTWIGPAEDVCDGSPITDFCRPPKALNISGYKSAEYSVVGAEKVDQNTYAVNLGDSVEISFIFEKKISDALEASKICEKDFLSLGRTIGDRVNPVCGVQLLTANVSISQKLQCRVKVKLDRPMNYAEKVCNVYGIDTSLKQSSVVQLVVK